MKNNCELTANLNCSCAYSESNDIQSGEIGCIYRELCSDMDDDNYCLLGSCIRLKTFVGTFSYMAPEVLALSIRNYMISDGYGASIDWWSYGATLYKLLFGIQPYRVGPKSLSHYQQLSIQVLHESRVRYMHPKDIHDKIYEPVIYDWIDSSNTSYDGLLIPKCASQFLSHLLKTDPNKRLHGNSRVHIGDNYGSLIKSHEVFEGVDWAAVESGVATPVYIPLIEKIHYVQSSGINRGLNGMNCLKTPRDQGSLYHKLMDSSKASWVEDECKHIGYRATMGYSDGKYTKYAYHEIINEVAIVLPPITPTAVLTIEEDNCFKEWYFVSNGFPIDA